jgi:hypothetical protein
MQLGAHLLTPMESPFSFSNHNIGIAVVTIVLGANVIVSIISIPALRCIAISVSTIPFLTVI